jgi:hypothetical protein
MAFAFQAMAQTSSKSKSKDRFRERDDRKYPIRLDNANMLNTTGNDYAPVFYDNGIIFLSARSKRGPLDAKKEPFLEHYLSAFDGLGKLMPPEKFTFDGRKKSDFHEGAVAFSRDFKTALISRNNNQDGVIRVGKSGKSTQKIYKSYYGFPDVLYYTVGFETWNGDTRMEGCAMVGYTKVSYCLKIRFNHIY